MQSIVKGPAGAPSARRKCHVCPWWAGYFLDNPFRRWVHPPDEILRPYVREGMTVLDIGCGFGLFSIGMARLVGESGRVIAVDLQAKMLEKAMERARRAGVGERITPVRCAADSLGVSQRVDFALASNVVHETPDDQGLFEEVHGLLEPGGVLFVMEPAGHISVRRFEQSVETAANVGFTVTGRPKVWRERCVLLSKTGL